MPYRLHILGASGSGTTTLGRALASQIGCPHFETDDYFWESTTPPFQKPRPREDRQTRLAAALAENTAWVLSGSLCGWGDHFIPLFDSVVFLTAPTEIRLARLQERERQRYGAGEIAAAGRMYESHMKFLSWASEYDTGGTGMRSRQLHEEWIQRLNCPVLRLDGAQPLAINTFLAIQAVTGQHL